MRPAVIALGGGTLLPVHWGTFHAVTMNLGSLGWMTRPVGVFQAAMDRRGIADRALVLGVGQRVEVA